MSDDDTESIIIYSDYVCPFCYLGRESLNEYEASRGESLSIDWHPFDLRSQKRGPDGEIDQSIDDGKDEDYYEQARENVRRLKEKYDAEMSVEIAGDIDSLPAQIASYYVKTEYPDQWRAFDEAIFEALWIDERDIGDPDVLADLATDLGLDGTEIADAIEDEDVRDRVFERFREAQQHGVTGVPTFAYDGYAARGAVPPEQLQRLVEGT